MFSSLRCAAWLVLSRASTWMERDGTKSERLNSEAVWEEWRIPIKNGSPPPGVRIGSPHRGGGEDQGTEKPIDAWVRRSSKMWREMVWNSKFISESSFLKIALPGPDCSPHRGGGEDEGIE
ncbi:hypothetical protein BDK51DRAFT_29618 [Blyttiomyces helicus]|uniref:Secreted protein n=1 Tax=Blyttiomyces helicus TaxID=388810 RepID=A0A4P9WNA0_9FUNG|nr:hypothetical protein BDK51DRAFT_29618 [Blyttiomyces helicus]|eukprot:RKO94414.1 hypothetical protein BDK51DRAFT_29618 [Blyttiomyces helicus]